MKSLCPVRTACVACLIALLFFFSFVTPCPVSAAPQTTLKHYVDTGKLSPGIKQKIDEAGTADVLVSLEVSDVRKNNSEERKARGLKFNDKKIVDENARKYGERKKDLLARMQQDEYLLLKDYEHFPVVHLRVNEQSLNELLQMGGVAVHENRKVYHHLAQTLPFIGATQAHSNGYTGAGTSVAVLDTGVNYTLSDLGNCTAPSPGPPSSCKVPNDPYGTCKVACVGEFDSDGTDGDLDEDGHGTNVSGIVLGVAPGAKIIGLDVFRSDDAAYENDILDALDWVLANKDTYSIVAVNMSLGGGQYFSECGSVGTLPTRITDLKNAGIATVISSGNEGYTDSISWPGCSPDALSVGAVYDANIGTRTWYTIYPATCTDSTSYADKVTCFSNSASFLKLLAPGVFVNAAGSTYSGTSQAAPHVAGSVAVLKEADNSLTVDAISSVLTSTGVSVNDPRNSIVKPRLDLAAAVSVSITAPLIGYSPDSLFFEAIQGSTLPLSQLLAIRNDGVGIMNWTVDAGGATWLDFSQTSGTGDTDVTVSVATTALAPGGYNTTITITSPEATNSPRTVPVTYTVYDSQYSEDFETGDLFNLPWTTYGDAEWFVQNTTTLGSGFSAESGDISDNQVTYLEVTLNITSPGSVSFWAKTSTEDYWGDRLMFYVDGDSFTVPWYGIYGETPWTEFVSEFPVTAGIHTFTWEYEKDFSASSGADAVWLDNIVFPPFNLNIPNISIDPTSHDFGNVAVNGSSAAEVFTVSNTGSANLIIATVSLTGVDASLFSVTGNTCSGQTLVPSGSCAIDIVFSPASTGAKSASLSITSNDPDTSALIANLSGTGLTPYVLTVAKTGTGTGTVTSVPAGIDCGLDCSEEYLDGTLVTLSAVPGGDSSFDGWPAECSIVGDDCQVTMSAAVNLSVSFSILPPVAAFSGIPTSGSAPLIVDFTDSSTNSPTSWVWDFGDGFTSTEQNPRHIFEFKTPEPSYTVTLTVSNGSGVDQTTAFITPDDTCTYQPVRVDGVVYHDDIQTAYSSAAEWTAISIDSHGKTFVGDLTFANNVDVTFSGGKNCDYTDSAMGTKLSGALTISAGTVAIENLIIM